MNTDNAVLISFATANELASAVANAWLDEIESAVRADKPHCVALSGGRITQKFFAAVVEQNQIRHVSFAQVHFFWADERCVPPDDSESNFKMANELLFAPLNIAAGRIHRLRGEAAPSAAAKIAGEEIVRFVSLNSHKRPELDLIFLGMGEDGHIASLFPNATPEIWDDPGPFIVIHNSPKPPPTRLSLSLPAIATAKNVWVLASGAGKEGALRDSLGPADKTPLARVIRSRFSTKIFTDIPLP